MNKGSPQPGPVYYERRGGEWVEKNPQGEHPSKVKTVNDVLGILPSPYGCSHEWERYKGPIPAVATKIPVYYYTCINCKIQKTSSVNLPMSSDYDNVCKHDFEKDPGLGPGYWKYEACTKCGYQRINL